MDERAGPPPSRTGPAIDSLLRHRWLTAAGMTATIAAMAGGGVLLAQHETGGGAPRDCGLVPCTATLPPSATSGAPGHATGREQPAPSPSARADREASPAAGAAGAAGNSAAAPRTGSAAPRTGSAAPGTGSAAGRVSWTAGQGSSADHGIGVGYEISRGPGGTVQGRIVILDRGRAPVTGWRLRLVLPGDRHYQVINARSISAGDSLVVQPGAGQGTLSPGRFELVAFTAQGTSSAPVSCLVEDDAGVPARAGTLRPAGTGRPTGGGLGQPRGGRGNWPGPGGGEGGGGNGWSGAGWGGNGWSGNGWGGTGWGGNGGGRGQGGGPGDVRTGPGGGWPGPW